MLIKQVPPRHSLQDLHPSFAFLGLFFFPPRHRLNGHGVIAWRGFILLFEDAGLSHQQLLSLLSHCGAQLFSEIFLVSWAWLHQLRNK